MIRLSNAFLSFIRPSEHSMFSPSSADRWITCPFSISASSGLPEKPNKYAAAGTKAHTVCEDYANHYFFEMEKTLALMEADDDEMRCAQGWVAVLEAWLTNRKNELGDILYFNLETGIPIYPLKGCFGTSDAVIVGTKACVILDFKNGTGHAVGARATQLKLYALGMYLHMLDLPADYIFHSVVYQPNLDDLPKEASYTMDEMHAFSNEIVKAIDIALEGKNLTPVLGSHCHYCKARTVNDPAKKCPAQKQKQIEASNENFAGLLAEINAPVASLADENVVRDRALVKILALLPLLNSIAKDAAAEFEERLAKGETIDGLKLAAKLGNREWVLSGDDLIKAIESKHKNVKATYVQPEETKIKALTAIEKEVGKGKLDNSLTMKRSKKVLVLMDQSVKEILGNLANYGQSIASLNEEESDGTGNKQ